MKLPKEKSAVAAREAIRQLENPLTEAQNSEKGAVETERIRKIQRTKDRNSENLRAMAERRSVAGAEGLAAEASRKSSRRKSHPLTADEKAEKARADAERRNVAGAKFVVADAIRKSAHRKINPSTVEHKAKKAVADAIRYRQSRLTKLKLTRTLNMYQKATKHISKKIDSPSPVFRNANDRRWLSQSVWFRNHIRISSASLSI